MAGGRRILERSSQWKRACQNRTRKEEIERLLRQAPSSALSESWRIAPQRVASPGPARRLVEQAGCYEGASGRTRNTHRGLKCLADRAKAVSAIGEFQGARF